MDDEYDDDDDDAKGFEELNVTSEVLFTSSVIFSILAFSIGFTSILLFFRSFSSEFLLAFEQSSMSTSRGSLHVVCPSRRRRPYSAKTAFGIVKIVKS